MHGFNVHKDNLDQLNLLSRMLISIKVAGALLLYILAMPFLAVIGKHAVMKYSEKGAHHLSHLLAALGVELLKRRNF